MTGRRSYPLYLCKRRRRLPCTPGSHDEECGYPDDLGREEEVEIHHIRVEANKDINSIEGVVWTVAD
jgi:hypothetical protein